MDQAADQERSWSDLPTDILDLIYERVSPVLMAFIDNVKCKYYHPVLENTSYEDYPELEDFNSRISAVNFEWLLMNEGDCCLSFYNPSTFYLIPVPQPTDTNFQIFHFSSQPTSSDCTIIAMKNHDYYDIGTKIGIIKRGEKGWTIKQFNEFGKFQTSFFCNAVFFDDRFYFMAENFSMGIFDVKANDWKVSDKHLLPLRKIGLYRAIGMVEDNGGIMVVYENCESQKLYLARFDPSKMTWEKVDCLGDDQVLYVSRGGSYLETIAAKGMGNRIYLPYFHGENGIFYSLATHKYQSSDGRFCSEGPYRLNQPRFCTWIIPNYSEDKVESWFDEK